MVGIGLMKIVCRKLFGSGIRLRIVVVLRIKGGGFVFVCFVFF